MISGVRKSGTKGLGFMHVHFYAKLAKDIALDLPYRWLRLHDGGGALVVWPGMLFPNSGDLERALTRSRVESLLLRMTQIGFYLECLGTGLPDTERDELKRGFLGVGVTHPLAS